MSAIFLEKISEGKIRGASPPLSANTKRFDSAYVAGGSAGLQTVDIRNPDSPRNIDSVETPGEAPGVYQLYNLLIVADGSRGLQLIDNNQPRSLSIVASFNTPGETRNVYSLASTVYAAGLGFGLGVFDVIDRSRLITNGHFLINPDQ